MHKYSALLLLALLAAAAGGQESFSPAEILQVQAKTGKAPNDSDPARDLAELQRCLLKLKAEREALASDQGLAWQQSPGRFGLEGSETSKLRLRVVELLTKLGMRNESKKNAEPGGPPLPAVPPVGQGNKGDAQKPNPSADQVPGKTDEMDTPDAGAPLNPVALAHVLYKAGNYEQALKAYRMVNLTGMKVEEKSPIQYMTAACLRKLGKMDEATALFRDVANVRGDDQLAACAQWQLLHLRWRSEFEAQLKSLQERRKALEALP
jgi:tetratricopeptide (TPR) repeat protein